MFPMSEKSYSIDDIIKEIQENKLNDEDLARYAKDYQKYDTTALLDDVLGRKSDDLLAGIPVSDSELTEEENKLLEQILSGEEPLVEEKKPEPKLMPASEKGGRPMIKPLRPVSETPEAQSFAPLQKTPATAHGKDFAVHRDSVTGLISKVDIQEEAQRQARAALEERESKKVAKRLSGYKANPDTAEEGKPVQKETNVPQPSRLEESSPKKDAKPFRKAEAKVSLPDGGFHPKRPRPFYADMKPLEDPAKQMVPLAEALGKKGGTVAGENSRQKGKDDSKKTGLAKMSQTEKPVPKQETKLPIAEASHEPKEQERASHIEKTAPLAQTKGVASTVGKNLRAKDLKQETVTQAQEVPTVQPKPEPVKETAAPKTEKPAKQPAQGAVPVQEPEKETAGPQIKRETIAPKAQTATFVAHTEELTQALPSLSVEEPTIEATPYNIEEPTVEADPVRLPQAHKSHQKPSAGDGTFSSVTTEIQGTPLNAAGVKTSVDLSDTAKLKYIALRKNRESKVRDFALEPDYNKNSPSEQAGKEIEEDLSINVTPPPMNLPLIEDLTSELEREEKENSPLFRSGKNKEQEKKLSKRWEEEEDLSEEEEFVSYSQTEEFYDILHELKHGMIFRCVASVVIFVLSIAMTLLAALPNGNPVELVDPHKNPMFFCLSNFVLMVLLCLFSIDVLRDGWTALVRKKFNKATMYSLALPVTTLSCAVILTDPEMVNQSGVFLYVPLTALCMAGWYLGRAVNASRVVKNFHFISGKTDKYSADLLESQRLAEDFTKGALNNRYPRFVLNRKTSFLSGFLAESFSEDLTDRQSKFVVLAVGGISVISAVAAFLLGGDIYTALTVLSGVLIVGAGITPAFVSVLPMAQAQKDLSRLGGAVLGYNAADSYSDVNSILVSANDLFRANDVTLYGIKTFSNMAIDRAILDATSVLCETKSILGGIFLNIISDRKDYLDPVDTVIYEDGMGISAWIKDRRVLIGSRELMINHNIDVPSRDYESRYLAQNRNLIYLSAAGELSAVFVIGVTGNDESRNMLVDLYNHDITVIVKTVDPILTRGQLAQIFDMPEDSFRVIPSRLHKEEETLSVSEEPLNGAVSNNGTFPAYLYSVLSAKLLYRKIQWMQLANCVSIGVGVLLFIAFTAMKSVSQLSNLTLCFYEVIWLAAVWGLSKLKKLIS